MAGRSREPPSRCSSSTGASKTVAPAPTCGWPKARDASDHRRRGTLDAGQRPGREQRGGPSQARPSRLHLRPELGHHATGTGHRHGSPARRTATIKMRGGLAATGTVTDPEGKPIAGAVVVRGDDPYLEWGSQEVRTDDHGVYKLPPLPRGPVTVTVVAPGWMPALKKVDITARAEAGRLPPRAGQGVAGPHRRPLGEADPGRLRFDRNDGAAASRSTTIGIPTSSTRRFPTRPTKPGSTCGPGLRAMP